MVDVMGLNLLRFSNTRLGVRFVDLAWICDRERGTREQIQISGCFVLSTALSALCRNDLTADDAQDSAT